MSQPEITLEIPGYVAKDLIEMIRQGDPLYKVINLAEILNIDLRPHLAEIRTGSQKEVSMTQFSRKAGDYPARKAIVEQGDDPPFDPARLEILAKVFETVGGVDVKAFRSAIASGDKPTYGAALVDALNEFITPAGGPPTQTGGAAALAQTRPEAAPSRTMPVKRSGEEIRRQQGKKASLDPYYQLATGLTKGWDGPDAA